ncbi:MAG TPA: alpha-galactosidase [Dehalococcoidia bacterium]|nr:alpha-galactosidase [Dehalococcoidia bacterium]
MSKLRIDDYEHGPAITNGHITVRVHLNKGTYDVVDQDGDAILSDAAFSVALKDGPTFTSRGSGLTYDKLEVDDPQGHGHSLVLQRETDEGEPLLSATITLYPDHPFAVVCPMVENPGPAPVRVQAFHPADHARLDLGAPATALRFYKHGWQSWSPTIVLDCGPTPARLGGGEDIAMSPPVTGPGTQPPPTPGRFTSDLVTAIADPATGRGLVAGYISAFDQFSYLWFDTVSSELNAASYADGIEVPAGKWLAAERFLIDPGDPIAGLEHFGDALGREMSAIPVKSVVSGWCSWYYYFTGVSEDEVIANLDDLAANRDAIPVDVFQIDDGYQSEIGDWLTVNEKFPHGMKWCADQIHERGYQAGLWVAPFLAGAKSQLFREHPDWFVKYSTGMPAIATVNWNQPCFALDLTHPEVQAWCADVFRTVFDEWGYDYVKIDFIFAAAVDGVRHDPNLTRAQAYRKGLDIVREAAGDRFVLACGNPMGPSVGLVDAARIGPDVAPFWYPMAHGAPRPTQSDPSALNSIRNTISRWWMHGRLWQNDPDCLLVRSTETQMSGDEVRALTTVIGLTGGMMLDSDKLTALTPERRDYISLCLPVFGESTRPVDLFETPDVARTLRLDLPLHSLIAAFNWDDGAGAATVQLPEGEWHVFELWEEEYLGVHSGALTLPVPPHGVRLLRLTPDKGHPQVVGSNLHILMGALEVAGEEWDGETLRVTLRPVAKKDGALWVARGGGVERVAIEGLVEERVVEA